MRMLMPSHAKNVVCYEDPEPLFGRYQIERQLNAMFSPYVNLRSGGYLVINQTEALVSIDINSGKATREFSIEETALSTNLEAADEIARQLKLRDLAGLIVIDFIDMEEKRNNRAVERRLKEALRFDRARIQVGRISHFGLLEMSRQRLRTGVLEGSTSQCPHCQGTGVIRSTESVALAVLRGLEDALMTGQPSSLLASTTATVALYILNNKRNFIIEMESRYGISIQIQASDKMQGATFTIERLARRDDQQPRRVERGAVNMESGFEEEESSSQSAATEDGGGDGEQGDGRRRRRRRRRGRRDDQGPRMQSRQEGDDDRDDSRDEERHGEEGTNGYRQVADAEDEERLEAADHDDIEADDTSEAKSEDSRDREGGDERRGRRGRRRGRRGGRRTSEREASAEAVAGEDDETAAGALTGDDGEQPELAAASAAAINSAYGWQAPAVPAPELADEIQAVHQPDIEPATPASFDVEQAEVEIVTMPAQAPAASANGVTVAEAAPPAEVETSSEPAFKPEPQPLPYAAAEREPASMAHDLHTGNGVSHIAASRTAPVAGEPILERVVVGAAAEKSEELQDEQRPVRRGWWQRK